MSPWFKVMLLSHYEGFVAASIFIIKAKSFDRGIYLITAIE